MPELPPGFIGAFILFAPDQACSALVSVVCAMLGAGNRISGNDWISNRFASTGFMSLT